jgi:hypothetical protein
MELLRSLASAETPSQLRRVALRTSGFFLSPYALVNAKTGELVTSDTLRAVISMSYNSHDGQKSKFDEMKQVLLSMFWNQKPDEKFLLFQRHHRVRLILLNQRRVTQSGKHGNASLQPPALHKSELQKIRARILARDDILRREGGVLVLFDENCHPRTTKEDINAARYAVKISFNH